MELVSLQFVILILAYAGTIKNIHILYRAIELKFTTPVLTVDSLLVKMLLDVLNVLHSINIILVNVQVGKN